MIIIIVIVVVEAINYISVTCLKEAEDVPLYYSQKYEFHVSY